MSPGDYIDTCYGEAVLLQIVGDTALFRYEAERVSDKKMIWVHDGSPSAAVSFLRPADATSIAVLALHGPYGERYDWIPPHSPAHPNSISHETGFIEPDGRLRWTAFIQDHSFGNVTQFRYSVRAYWNTGVSEGFPYMHKMDFESVAPSLEEAKSRCEMLLDQRRAE